MLHSDDTSILPDERIPLTDNPSPSSSSPAFLRPHSRRALHHLLVSSFLFTTSIALTFPVRPQIVLKAASDNASLAGYYTGIVDSMQAILSIFICPLLGAVSDTVGRRPIFIFCHVGEFLALLIIAQFPTSLILQFPAYLLFVLTTSYFIVCAAIIADVATDGPVQTASYFGYLGAVNGVSFMLGPLLGGLIEASFYPTSSFHFAAFFVLLTMIYVYLFLPETLLSASLQTSQSRRHWSWFTLRQSVTRITQVMATTNINPLKQVRTFFLDTAGMRWLAISIAMASLALNGLLSFFFLYLTKELSWGTSDTGYFLSALGLTLIVCQAIMAPLIIRLIGERWTIVTALFLHCVQFIMYGLARSTMGIYLALFVGAVVFAYDPALKAILAKQTTPDKQGALQGSVAALRDLVKPFGPIVSTSLYGFGNGHGFPSLPFYALSVVILFSSICAKVALWKPDIK